MDKLIISQMQDHVLLIQDINIVLIVLVLLNSAPCIFLIAEVIKFFLFSSSPNQSILHSLKDAIRVKSGSTVVNIFIFFSACISLSVRRIKTLI